MPDTKKVKLENIIWPVVSAITLVQCVLALIWLSKNLFVFHNDFYANCYIKAAETFIVDDNLGILYAILVRLLGHKYFLYIGQMAAVFFSAYLLTESKLVALFILSNPLILQSTVMVRPEAFILSAIMIIIFSLTKLYRTSALRYLAVALITILCIGFLHPDYAYLCPIAVLPVAVIFLIKRKSGSILLLFGLLLVFFVSTRVNDKISKPYAYGGVEHTVSFLKMKRLAQKDSSKLAEWMQVYFDEDFTESTQQADMIPEYYEFAFAYKLEKVIGNESANEFYDYMSEVSLSRGYGFWVKPIVKDFAYYFLSPLSVGYVYYTEQTDTLLFTPMSIFVAYFPRLSGFYFAFGIISLILVSVFAVFRLIKCISWIKYLYVSFILSIYATLICTRGYDYRNVLFVIVSGALASLSLYERNME